VHGVTHSCLSPNFYVHFNLDDIMTFLRLCLVALLSEAATAAASDVSMFTSRSVRASVTLRSARRANRFQASTKGCVSAEPKPGSLEAAGPSGVKPDDLWGIRDFLLLGYDGTFMKPDSEGLRQVRASAMDLLDMLPQLHPHPACRQQMEQTLEQDAGDNISMLATAAEASWRCLPANLSGDDFTSVYSASGIGNVDEAKRARFPEFQAESSSRVNLGACASSKWPRTCSYWVALHLMAFRADALGLSARFLRSVMNVISGGALLCAGCTLHFREMHEDHLSQAVRDDYGSDF